MIRPRHNRLLTLLFLLGSAGSLCAVDNLEISVTFTVDATAPTADIADVTPDPRATDAGVVTIDFSEDVTGFDLGDLTLTRDAGNVDLSALTLVQVSPSQYTIDLGSVTATDGSYVLTLAAAGSGIVDQVGNPLAGDATDDWQMETPPQIVSALTGDADADGQVDRLTITWDKAVDIADGDPLDGFPQVALGGGYVVADADYAATGTTTLALSLVESGVPDTNATPSVTFTNDGDVVSAATGADAAGFGPANATDGAGPAIASASTTTTTTVTVTLSEPVDDATIVAGDFTFSGFATAGANTTAAGFSTGGTADDDTIVLTLAATIGSSETGSVAFTGAGVVDDLSANGNTQTGAVGVADGIGAGSALAYSAITFAEATADDGTIGNVLVVTVTGDSFVSANTGTDLVAGGQVSVLNVPAGLTLVATQDSTAQVTLSMAGNATSHADADDVTDLTVAFQDGAFTGGSAAAVVDATRNDLVVDFDPSTFPTLDPIAPVIVDEDADVTAVDLTGIGPGADGTSVGVVDAWSDDASLVLDPMVTYTDPATFGQLAFAPVAGRSGVANVTVRVIDDAGRLRDRTFAVTVQPVNDAPTLDALADVAMTEDDAPLAVALSGIGSGAADEVQALSVSALSGNASLVTTSVTYTSADPTGSLVLTPVADAAGTTAVWVTVRDDGGTSNGGDDEFTRAFIVSIAPQDDPPLLDTNEIVTVEVGSTGLIGPNRLHVTDDGGPGQVVFTVAAAPTKGTLANNGTALGAGGTFTQADIDDGLVTYTHGGTVIETDSFDVDIADGGGSVLPTATVAIDAVLTGSGNTAPTLALSTSSMGWTEGDGAQLVDAGATVSDPDGTLAQGVLSAELIANADAGDRLRLRHQGTGPGEVGVVGTTVSYEGTAIGTWTGGDGATPLHLFLDATATPTAVQAALRVLTFENVSANPSAADRTLQVLLDDGDGGVSSPVSLTIEVTTVNDPPALALSTTATAFVEDGGAVLLDDAAGVVDADSPDLDAGFLSAAISANGTANDRLAIRHQGTAAGEIGVSGTSVTYGGAVIGSWSGGTATTPLRIDFNAAATPTAVQALVRNLTFDNTSDQPDTSTRSLAFALEDGDGGASAPAGLSVSVVRSNDPPAVTLDPTALAYDDSDGSAPLDPAATVVDPDSADFDGGLLTVSFTAGATADDRVTIRDQGTGAGEVGVSAGTVTYEGTAIGTVNGDATDAQSMLVLLNDQATPTAAQALVRNLLYANTSSAPATGTRTVEVVLSDGDGGTSSTATRDVDVSDLNTPPAVTLASTSGSSIENDPPLALFAGSTVADGDSADFDGGTLTVSIVSGAETGDVLAVTDEGTGAGQIGVSGTAITYGGTQIGTLGGTATTLVVDLNDQATPAAVTDLLEAVTYEHQGENPSGTDRVVQVVVDDGDGDASAAQSVTVGMTPVDDAPVASDLAIGTVPGIAISDLLPALDHEGQTLTWELVAAPTQGTATLDDAATGAFTYTPDLGATGSDSFTFRVSDGGQWSSEGTVTVYVTAFDEARPHAAADPPMEVMSGDTYRFVVRVDTSELGVASPDTTFRLVGSPPAGMTLTPLSPTTAELTWPVSEFSDHHRQVGVLFTETTTNRTSYQPILIFVRGEPQGNI